MLGFTNVFRWLEKTERFGTKISEDREGAEGVREVTKVRLLVPNCAPVVSEGSLGSWVSWVRDTVARN